MFSYRSTIQILHLTLLYSSMRTTWMLQTRVKFYVLTLIPSKKNCTVLGRVHCAQPLPTTLTLNIYFRSQLYFSLLSAAWRDNGWACRKYILIQRTEFKRTMQQDMYALTSQLVALSSERHVAPAAITVKLSTGCKVNTCYCFFFSYLKY